MTGEDRTVHAWEGSIRMKWSSVASRFNGNTLIVPFFPTARARGTANVSGPYRNGSLDLAGYLRFCGQWILMMHGRLLHVHVRPLLCHWCDAAGASQPRRAPGQCPKEQNKQACRHTTTATCQRRCLKQLSQTQRRGTELRWRPVNHCC